MQRDPRITWSRRSGFPDALARPLARRLRRAAVAMRVATEDLAGLGVRIVSDGEIATLHWRHMGIVGPTDVLSFRTMPWFLGDLDEPAAAVDAPRPAAATRSPEDNSHSDDLECPSHAHLQPPALYGDLALSWAAVQRQATGASPVAHLDEATRLLVHGLAHLEGHDHRHRPDARRMHAYERRGLSGAQTPDVPRPYAPASAIRVRGYGGVR